MLGTYDALAIIWLGMPSAFPVVQNLAVEQVDGDNLGGFKIYSSKAGLEGTMEEAICVGELMETEGLRLSLLSLAMWKPNFWAWLLRLRYLESY